MDGTSELARSAQGFFSEFMDWLGLTWVAKVVVLGLDDLKPTGGWEGFPSLELKNGWALPEMLPKIGFVPILPYRSMKATRSLNSPVLRCLSIISSALRRHLSLMLKGSLKINFWMFPGWSNFEAYWLPARAFLQLNRKIANLLRAVPSSAFIKSHAKALD